MGKALKHAVFVYNMFTVWCLVDFLALNGYMNVYAQLIS